MPFLIPTNRQVNYYSMLIEVKVPGPGESVTEVEIGRWLVENGALISKGADIAEVESDKATLTLVAEAGGKITLLALEGDTVPVGSVVCTIDTAALPLTGAPATEIPDKEPSGPPVPAASAALHPSGPTSLPAAEAVKMTPTARRMMAGHGLSVEELIAGLKRIGKKEVEAVLQGIQIQPPSSSPAVLSRDVRRERMSLLRRKLSERLVAVKNETAMLTTFNEVDMEKVLSLRKQYQDHFSAHHGFKLGFMSFFTKAVALAAQSFPSVNSMIDGEELVIPDYADVGIAVQTPRGLMVPVIRNAGEKSIPQLELEIKELAEKARNKKITVEELSGGTITITNGGVFGSLFSTPILNPPQSAILGMHNIVERPVAVQGKVEIRPMMYIALSYDHRVIDGRDSVGFLVKVKELVENPVKMATGGKDPLELLLGL